MNGLNMGNRVLFLDDFVAGGDTKKRVEDAVSLGGGKVVATFLYRDLKFDSVGPQLPDISPHAFLAGL